MDYDSSGCTNSWAEMREGTCVFACMGCREVARLVGEVEDIKQMMKRIVTGQGLKENGEETGSSCRTGRSRGEVRRSDDNRQQYDRRKPEEKGDSVTHFVRR